MKIIVRRFLAVALGILASAMLARAGVAAPVKIGYSDWPGWVAWQVPIEKGWLKQAGIDVTFQWFDYVASMDAFAAGKLDGVMMTNGDALVTGSGGGKSVMVLITDYSNGNDMIVARPGIKTFKELKGKKIGIETGFVEHLMLLKALEQNGMTEKDVTLVNTKTNETPQVLASRQVDAIGAWQPNSGMAMKAVPGSRPVYTSAQAPGLIYDVIAVSPASLKANRATYAKLAQVWDRTVKYIKDPKAAIPGTKMVFAGIKDETEIANLTAFLLRRFASTIHAMVAPNGCLVLSGFTADQVPLVTDVFPGWTVVSRLDEDDWVGLLLRR